ncbi:Beta-galactosidase C-terminal domain [Streptomyces coffeae]|uniref:Beta-galactosidase C-terminal domain n=1 Tax=Streptomyces coffeae TaxID=621382 RepID=UPI0027DDCE22|nr:Beta-galactosidase C-terminal domain [Streptomyces coffeae]
MVGPHAPTEAGVTSCAPVPEGVEATVRTGPDASYLFLLNHADKPVEISAHGTDLLTGAPVRGAVQLVPLGAAVLRTPHSLGGKHS